jgi:tRNA G18 (ribose-2'-O)-methylase SpoU
MKLSNEVGAMRGYFGIGIENTKNKANIGTLYRSALAFGADYIFTVGKRYEEQCSDTAKAWRHIPLFHFRELEDLKLPYGCRLVGIEIDPNAYMLPDFIHPERACYLLGAEDRGLSKKAIDMCHMLVRIPSNQCLNVSVAGSIVMYDRLIKW